MRRLLVGLLICAGFLASCAKKNPLEVTAYKIGVPSAQPLFDRSVLGENHNFTVGYHNGNIQSDRVTLTWQRISDSSFLCYKLMRDNFLIETFADADQTEYTDSTLFQNRQYEYKIIVLNDQAASKIDTMTIPTPSLAGPTNVNYLFLSETMVQLYWTNRMQSAADFEVSRRQGADDFELLDTVTDTFYVDRTVQEGEWSEYQVVAKNDFETSDTTRVNLFIQEIFNSPVITSIRQLDGSRSVEIEWRDNSNSESEFEIFRDSNLLDPIATVPLNQTVYTDNDTTNALQIGDEYTYWVRAVNAIDETDFSAPVQITILDPAQTGISEGFESGTLPSGWVSSGDASWFVTNITASEGTRSVQAGSITHNQWSALETTVFGAGTYRIEFDYRVSSEGSFDYLVFYTNYTMQDSWSGESGWNTYSGIFHTTDYLVIAWNYKKDSTADSGSDTAWIDNVRIEKID
ncbi:hypothetical protein HQ585_18965 [candidate division KSB1 bacterium]|nr:hypothetical protein [candidate division KSB1 bacterium]